MAVPKEIWITELGESLIPHSTREISGTWFESEELARKHEWWRTAPKRYVEAGTRSERGRLLEACKAVWFAEINPKASERHKIAAWEMVKTAIAECEPKLECCNRGPPFCAGCPELCL